MSRLRLGRKRDPKAALRDVLGDYELPSFPRLVNEAIGKISAVDANLVEIGELLGNDPGVSARLLRIVNSATFAPLRPIDSVSQAVTMLGKNQVESLLISIGVRRSLPVGSIGGLDSRVFWVTSARRAAMAAAIAGRTEPASKSATFTAALLMDMAIPVLAQCQDRYAATMEESGNVGGVLAALEEDRYGWTHSEVGAWMGVAWTFPEILVDLIADHHNLAPSQGRTSLAALVSLIDPTEDPERIEEFIEHVTRLYGIEADDVVVMIEKSRQEAHHIAALFS